MRDIEQDVAYFHRLTDTPVCTTPAWPSDDRVDLRVSLIVEEVARELLSALASRDMVGTADAIIDSIYVLVGTSLELGLPFDNLWEEVQRANVSKARRDPATGITAVVRRPDGKILKPEGWTPPAIAEVLLAYGWKPPLKPT